VPLAEFLATRAQVREQSAAAAGERDRLAGQ
jgi:hypothetical protein